jgi:hypothetical protein
MKPDKNTITVEDLLKLKRAERPPAEFWAKFDAEMRAKQLSAIVSKRPWWDSLSRGYSVMRRLQLPMGAAAAVALTWVGVHYSGTTAAPVRELAANAVTPPAAALVHASAPASAKVAPAVQQVAAATSSAVAVADAPVVAQTSSHIVRAPESTPPVAASASPFADGIAVTLADYRTPSTDLPQTSVFSSDRDFEPTVAVARRSVSEPLAKMDPAEERRARLLAPALPAGPRTFASDWMKERASSNDRMYESMADGHSLNDQALVGFRF